jgi:DNA/RNA-binding protein KIN17
MRDENGFKCHVASESHVRNMMVIGEDPRKAINEYSNQFLSDFVKLLRTGHGEKKINVNHFYQEYISNKEHIHMNSTRWASLTEFAKHLGREGICRVEEEEADENGRGGGLMISWIDNSPDALRRQDALRKKDRQDKGDEEREWRGIKEQIARAKKDGLEEGEEQMEEAKLLQRKEGEKIKLSFGGKKVVTAEKDAKIKPPSPPLTDNEYSSGDDKGMAGAELKATAINATSLATPAKLSLKPSTSSKSQNILASAPKKNPLNLSRKPKQAPAASKPMSEAERIMREEIERKQRREAGGGGAFKKRRVE